MNRSDSTGLMDVPQQIPAPSEAGGGGVVGLEGV